MSKEVKLAVAYGVWCGAWYLLGYKYGQHLRKKVK